jgi:hypothetical protein
MSTRKTEDLATAEWAAAILGSDALKKAVRGQNDFPKDSAEWYMGCLRALTRELAEVWTLADHCEAAWLRWGRASHDEVQALGAECKQTIKAAYLLLNRLEFGLRRGAPGDKLRTGEPAFAQAAAAMLARAWDGDESGGQTTLADDIAQTEAEWYARRLDRLVPLLGDFGVTARNLSAWWATSGRVSDRYARDFAARLRKLAEFMADFAGKLRAGPRFARVEAGKTKAKSRWDTVKHLQFTAGWRDRDDREDEDLEATLDDMPTVPESKPGETLVIMIGGGGERRSALAVMARAAGAVDGSAEGKATPPEDSAAWFRHLLVYAILESYSIPSFEGYTKSVWIHQKQATREELEALCDTFGELREVIEPFKVKLKAFPDREAQAATLPVNDPAFAVAAAPALEWLRERQRQTDAADDAPELSSVERHARRIDNLAALLAALASTMENLAPWWFKTGSFCQEEIDLRASQFRAWAVPMAASAERIRQYYQAYLSNLEKEQANPGGENRSDWKRSR